MLQAAGYNVNLKRSDLRLFEQGYTYSFKDGKYRESEKFAILLTGDRYAENWMGKKGGYDIYYLKSVVNNLLQAAGINSSDIRSGTTQSEFTYSSLEMRSGNTTVATLGKLKPDVLDTFDVAGDVWYAEIDMGSLYDVAAPEHRKITEPPKYPVVKRDLSMILDKQVTFEQIRNVAYETERKLLINVNLFDVYEGKKIGDDKKSYAVSYYLMDREQTLTDKVIDKVMSKIISACESKLGASVRSS